VAGAPRLPPAAAAGYRGCRLLAAGDHVVVHLTNEGPSELAQWPERTEIRDFIGIWSIRWSK